MSTPSHSEPAREIIYFFENQEVTLVNFDAADWILDIGGGGEGVIGQIKGKQVVAVDISEYELKDSAPGPLKIIMDARKLTFLDDSFSVATAFFSLLFMSEEDQTRVLAEVWRVLTPGGRFLVWDVDLPVQVDSSKPVAAFPFIIHLPDGKEIRTGYGTRWPNRPHDLAYFLNLIQETGFQAVQVTQTGRVLEFELQKPLPSTP